MTALNEDQIERLTGAALDARTRAYAPYSDFLVGAAILTSDQELIVGCNIENASYSVTLCAERVAASTAVAGGKQDWIAIAIASDGGVTPCGACRQFLSEFSPELTIIMVDAKSGKRNIESLSVLLPSAFDASSLES